MVSKVATITLSDGKTQEFPRFTLDELDQLAEDMKAFIKNSLVKSATEDRWDIGRISTLKQNVDAKIVDISELYAAASSPKWMKHFLKKSLTKANVPADKHDEIITQIPMGEKVDICQKLIFDQPEIAKHEKAPDQKEGADPLARPAGEPPDGAQKP